MALKTLQTLGVIGKLAGLATPKTAGRARQLVSVSERKRFKEILQGKDVYQEITLEFRERAKLESEDWIVVASSNVKAIKLDSYNDKPELLIMFHNDSIYAWLTNAQAHYTRMLRAASKGKYIHKFLYGAHFSKIR